MKQRLEKKHRLGGAFAVAAHLGLATIALAQPTAFIYQGQLKDGAALAEGLHDFRFRLFDAASSGTQVGTTQCANNIQIRDGVFTTTVDFGNQFATPNARFIEVLVRRDTGLGCGDTSGYTTLAPRQPITPAPTATQAASAFSLTAPDGSPAKAVFVANDGKVGIGTLAPTHWLHVAAAGPTMALQDTNAASQQAGYVSYRDNANVERAWVGYGTPGDPDFSIVNARTGGDIILNPFSGNVGIGTSSPDARLNVVSSQASTPAVSGVSQSSFGLSGTSITGLVGIYGRGIATAVYGTSTGAASGVGVVGLAGPTGTNHVGVHGFCSGGDPNSYGVFATGRLGASGSKSFRIDHPDDPANRYLFHYSSESPEVINFYRGAVTLDRDGRALVPLPSYFAKVNEKPSYQLTAVGAPMPMLHVAEKISEQALAAGAASGPGDDPVVCFFRIAGGAPGGEVSWRVEARRNDPWIRANGAPIELQKTGLEVGTYQHPGLYGQPAELSADVVRARRLAPASTQRSSESLRTAPELHPHAPRQ